MSATQVNCQYDFLFILIACQQNKKSYWQQGIIKSL